MPAVSQKQQRFFAFLEHNPQKAAAEGIHVNMSREQEHDFAATPRKGLPVRAPKAPKPPKAPRVGRRYYGEG